MDFVLKPTRGTKRERESEREREKRSSTDKTAVRREHDPTGY